MHQIPRPRFDRPLAGVAERVAPRSMTLLCQLAAEHGGLSISPDRTDFMAARLGPEVARLGLADMDAYAERLGRERSPDDLRRFTEALATHTTSFFRENAQYDWLAAKGLDLMRLSERRGPFRIWSAACSSGQELYSALMVAAERLGEPLPAGRLIGIGTDISTRILTRARAAIYAEDEIAGLSIERRRRWLLSDRAGRPRYRINAVLRELARWEQANLADPGSLGAVRADLAMLRNVMIYFDAPTRDRVVRSVVERLAPGGILMTGHSEAIRAERYGLAALRPSIYRKET